MKKKIISSIILIYFLIIQSFTLYGQIISGIFCKGEILPIEHLLSSYIQIPSESGFEKTAGDFLKSICIENGLNITEFGNENGNYNFSASIYPLKDKKPNIIFLNHIDVVPADINSSWTFHPYSGIINNEEIHGRGAVDFKGVAIAQLFSIIHFSNQYKSVDLPYNVSMLSVSCEETDCDGGVKYVINNHLTELFPIVIIGEGPSALTEILGNNLEFPIFGISTAHKRSLWLNLEMNIETFGHGSVTPKNYSNKEMIKSLEKIINKNQKLIFNDLNISMLKNLGNLEKGLSKFILNHPKIFRPLIVTKLRKQPELFALFSITITLTNLYTEINKGVFNVIPSKTYCYLDCRLLPETNEEQFIYDLKKKLRSEKLTISTATHMPRNSPSPVETKFYKSIEKTIHNYYPNSTVFPILLPSSNDSGKFREKGILAYDFAPFHLNIKHLQNIHKENESIPIKALHDGVMVYLSFLKDINKIND